MVLVSCQKKDDYTAFVGTWGVERIDYKSYNTDYHGQPVQGSMRESTYTFDPNDISNGIQLIFRSDKTGEMRDSNIDTVWYDWNTETQEYESYVVNPDTTLVTSFTYSYDADESILYMNMSYQHTFTYMMRISDLTANSFVYENNYGTDVDNRVYFETAYLKRIDFSASKVGSRKSGSQKRPKMPGSFLSGR